MTVGAEDFQVRDFIVQVIAVNMLYLERGRFTAPLDKATFFTLGLLDP